MLVWIESIIITIMIVISIYLTIVTIGKFFDYMDRPNPKLEQEFRESQDKKIKWCKDQGGRAQFNKWNEYEGCK